MVVVVYERLNNHTSISRYLEKKEKKYDSEFFRASLNIP